MVTPQRDMIDGLTVTVAFTGEQWSTATGALSDTARRLREYLTLPDSDPDVTRILDLVAAAIAAMERGTIHGGRHDANQTA